MEKITIKKALLIKQALEELIKLKGHGLSLELTLNLFRLNIKIAEFNDQVKAIQDGFLLKENDKPVKVLVSTKGLIVRDEKGVPVPYNPEMELKDGNKWGNKFDPERLDEMTDAITKMGEEPIIWVFKVLPKAKIMDLAEKGVLDGVDYSSLLDVLIEI